MISKEDLELILHYAWHGMSDVNASAEDLEVLMRVKKAVNLGELGYIDPEPSDEVNPYNVPYDQALEIHLRNNGNNH